MGRACASAALALLEGRAEFLRATVEGSGDVRWRGEAKAEAVAVRGSGKVSHPP